MLIDLKFKDIPKNQISKENEVELAILEILGDNNKPKRLTKGVYITGLNFKSYLRIYGEIPDEKIKEFYIFTPENREDILKWMRNPKNRNYINEYGVCDNYKQVLKRYKKIVELKKRKFILSLTPILKSEQPEEDGWRWHKWGEYIGTKNPQYEYLYDEPKIDKVYCYHIYEILN